MVHLCNGRPPRNANGRSPDMQHNVGEFHKIFLLKVAQWGRTHLPVQQAWVQSLGREDPLEEGMATHSSILAWRLRMGGGAWWATVLGFAESDRTERVRAHTHTHARACAHTHTHTHTHASQNSATPGRGR